jgi:hypothetical protein
LESSPWGASLLGNGYQQVETNLSSEWITPIFSPEWAPPIFPPLDGEDEGRVGALSSKFYGQRTEPAETLVAGGQISTFAF